PDEDFGVTFDDIVVYVINDAGGAVAAAETHNTVDFGVSEHAVKIVETVFIGGSEISIPVAYVAAELYVESCGFESADGAVYVFRVSGGAGGSDYAYGHSGLKFFGLNHAFPCRRRRLGFQLLIRKDCQGRKRWRCSGGSRPH